MLTEPHSVPRSRTSVIESMMPWSSFQGESELGVRLGKAWLEGPRRGQVGPDLELVILAGRPIAACASPASTW
jgi:hypothetical protein